jgi:hypothetical protein
MGQFCPWTEPFVTFLPCCLRHNYHPSALCISVTIAARSSTWISLQEQDDQGTKVYNNLPKFLKEIDNYKAFKKELKLFLLHTFYSLEEFVSS